MITRLVVIAVFVTFGAAAVAVNLFSHRPESRLMPLAQFIQAGLMRRSVRVAILLFWWWIGWHFLVEPP